MLKRLLLVGAFVCAALAPATSGAQQSEDTLRWASTASITAVDPYFNFHREAMILNGQLVWDTLIYRDPDSGQYLPLLAKSWKWIDDTTLAFELRDDVLWHDGLPFTAEDAVYTYNYVSNPDNKINVQSNVNWIAGAEQTGPHSFVLKLKKPFPPALEYVASLHAMLPKDFYGEGGVAGGNGRLVGTGPYKIVNFAPGESIEVELTGSYFADSPKGQPTIKHIVYRLIPDRSTQLAELMSGGLDWIWYVPKDQAEPLSQIEEIKVLPAETMRISFLSYNLRDMEGGNPLQDIRVRQAIAYAIDREQLVREVVGEGSSVLTAPCFRTQFGCKQDVVKIGYDPGKAKALLAEAGYADGLTLELVAFRSREWTEALAGFLNNVGIKTNITVLEYAAARERVTNNTAHLFFGDWGSYSINDVSALLNNFFTLTPDDMAQDKTVSDALLAAAGTVDEKVRLENYDVAVTRIAEQLYWFPLWVHPVIYAYNSELDFKAFPDENPRFFLTRWNAE